MGVRGDKGDGAVSYRLGDGDGDGQAFREAVLSAAEVLRLYPHEFRPKVERVTAPFRPLFEMRLYVAPLSRSLSSLCGGVAA